MKKLHTILLLVLLLVPLWIVLFVGYPINISDLSYTDQFPGKTNRCFKIGDTEKLLKCFAAPTPKVKGRFFFQYFAEFSELFITCGILVTLGTYFAVWIVSDQDTERG